MRVSVVIPTFRRDESLLRCLAGLLRQDFPRDGYEIVVVDDARSGETCRMVERLAVQVAVRLRCLRGPGRGPAAARNAGWRAAGGEVIAFIDDDAYPADDRWLSAGVAALDGDGVAAVAGAIEVPCDDPPTDFQRNVRHLERSFFLTCNAFCWRPALERSGGFDERFRLPFREDSDLQFRIEAAGGTITKQPSARVVHPAPRGTFAGSLRLQRYAMYNALLYKKHPERYRRELQRWPPLRYYVLLLLAAGAIAARLSGRRGLSKALAAGWGGLELDFFARRLAGTTLAPTHVLDMMVTSVLIPPLAVYWRLRGALRFRVWFV